MLIAAMHKGGPGLVLIGPMGPHSSRRAALIKPISRMLDALMWQRLKGTIAVLIASGAVGTADIAHAEPRSQNGIINRLAPQRWDRLQPYDDRLRIRPRPCDDVDSKWGFERCQAYLREGARQRALQEASRSCAQAVELCVKADPTRARELLTYAADYLDADAQYQLGRLHLEGIGGPPDALQAAHWLSLAARNDHYQAQALLGRLALEEIGGPPSGMSPRLQEAFRSCTQAEYPAEHWTPNTLWKLGMYADGEGNKARAYEYFCHLIRKYGNASRGTLRARRAANDFVAKVQFVATRFVANAFVTLGQYHLEGIPDAVKADAQMAHDMFHYAASYFLDPEAAYHLGGLYLMGIGAVKDSMQAARWLRLAADKGEHRAQALLGRLLFNGEGVPREAARGLMFLMLAHDAAPEDAAIGNLLDDAFKHASVEEKEKAVVLLEGSLNRKRN